ncbi:MAG: sialidase family protein [Bacteroidales bacterium]
MIKKLPDPVCEGSILAIGKERKMCWRSYSNAADTSNRDNLTLRISLNDGYDWPIAIAVDRSPVSEKGNDYTAYADIVKISKHKIAVLYERNNYSEIVFTILKWSTRDIK